MGIKKKVAEKVIKTIAKTVSVDKILDGAIDKVTNSIEKGITDGVKNIKAKKVKTIEDIKNYKVKNNCEDIIDFFIEAKKNIKDKNIDDEEYNMWFLKIEEVYEKAQEAITDKKSLNKITNKYEELKREKKIKNFGGVACVLCYVILGICIFFGLNRMFLIGLGISILVGTIITFLYFNIDFTNISRSIKNFKFKETTENWICFGTSFLSIFIIIFGSTFYFSEKSQEDEAYNNYYDESVEKYNVSIEVDFEDNLLFSKYDVTLKLYDEEEYFEHGEDKIFNIELPEGTHKLEFNGNDMTEVVNLKIDGDTKVKYKLKCHLGSIEVSQVSKKNYTKDNNDEEEPKKEDNSNKKEESTNNKDEATSNPTPTIGESKTGTENNVEYKTYFTESNEMIIIATNNNEKNVEINVEVEFYDKNQKLVGAKTNNIDVSSKGSKFALNFSDIPKSYDSYKVYIDIEEIVDSSYLNDLKSVSSKTDEKVVIQIKNTTDKEIEYIKTAIIFYKDGKIVGYDESLDDDIKPDRSANFEFNYPHDEEFETIKIDDYEVFINEAYTSN